MKIMTTIKELLIDYTKVLYRGTFNQETHESIIESGVDKYLKTKAENLPIFSDGRTIKRWI
jgi:hypothetical protein